MLLTVQLVKNSYFVEYEVSLLSQTDPQLFSAVSHLCHFRSVTTYVIIISLTFIQILVITNLMHKILFYNKFIIRLYMFRALCALHQEVKIVLYSIWYSHTYRWPSGAQVERGLSQPVNRTATYMCDDTRCCIIQF